MVGVTTVVPNRRCLWLEYMQLGTLYDVIHDNVVHFSLDRILSMSIDATAGMEHLHR